MKQIYEEPTMIIMVLEHMDVVTLSSPLHKEPTDGDQGGYGDIF